VSFKNKSVFKLDDMKLLRPSITQNELNKDVS